MIGEDLIKKIIVYTLLMKKGFTEKDFFPYLMDRIWYKETVDLYFKGRYQLKYDEVINDFLDRGIVKRENGILLATIKP